MDNQKRKKILQLVALFAVPIVVYTIFDILIGETFRSMFIAPVFPLVDSAYHLRDDLELFLRGISFTFLLCIWSFPVFLFQRVKNIYFKILSCLLGTAIAAWYALMTWLSLFLWEDRVESWAKQVTDSSVFMPLLVVFGILGGIGLFYVGFTFIFYKILKTKKKTAIKGAK